MALFQFPLNPVLINDIKKSNVAYYVAHFFLFGRIFFKFFIEENKIFGLNLINLIGLILLTIAK